jgi:hypothetical protein
MPHFDAAAKSPNRSIQAVKVEESILPAVNQVLTTNINRSAKPLNVEGYPSIILVDKKGNAVTDLEPVRNTETMIKVMDNAGPLADQAGINKGINSEVGKNLKNSLKNIESITNTMNKPNNIKNSSLNTNKKLLSNIGVEESGLVSGQLPPKNIDVGEDELKGSIASVRNNKNKNISKELIKKTVAPSPLNKKEEVNVEAPSADIKKLSEEAEEITSLVAPLTPPNSNNDMEESISNSLTAEQKVSGGGRRGGSLYSSLARTTYTLAPAAILLATAASVMKTRKNKTSKRSKKSQRKSKRRLRH